MRITAMQSRVLDTVYKSMTDWRKDGPPPIPNADDALRLAFVLLALDPPEHNTAAYRALKTLRIALGGRSESRDEWLAGDIVDSLVARSFAANDANQVRSVLNEVLNHLDEQGVVPEDVHRRADAVARRET